MVSQAARGRTVKPQAGQFRYSMSAPVLARRGPPECHRAETAAHCSRRTASLQRGAVSRTLADRACAVVADRARTFVLPVRRLCCMILAPINSVIKASKDDSAYLLYYPNGRFRRSDARRTSPSAGLRWPSSRPATACSLSPDQRRRSSRRSRAATGAALSLPMPSISSRSPRARSSRASRKSPRAALPAAAAPPQARRRRRRSA
jgi:hypothetical protein